VSFQTRCDAGVNVSIDRFQPTLDSSTLYPSHAACSVFIFSLTSLKSGSSVESVPATTDRRPAGTEKVVLCGAFSMLPDGFLLSVESGLTSALIRQYHPPLFQIHQTFAWNLSCSR
jgi:hypothetical protein